MLMRKTGSPVGNFPANTLFWWACACSTATALSTHAAVLGLPVVFAAGIFLPSATAIAQNLHYDTTDASGLNPGVATWDLVTPAWQVSATPGTAAPGLWTNGQAAVFNTIAGTNTLTISGAISTAGLVSGTNGVVTNIGGGALTLTGNITVNGTGSSLTIADTTAVTLATNMVVTVNSTPTVTINGDIGETGGARSLTKATAGLLTLAGNNNYTGGTTLTGGALALGSANAIGTTGTVTFSGGAIRYTAANNGDNSARFSNAANQQYRVDTNGESVTLGTALTSAGGSMTKTGAGTLSLTGANTFTGGTTISVGTLLLSGANDRLSTVGNITVNGNGVFLNLGGNTQTTSGIVALTRGTVLDGTISNSGSYVTNTADGMTVSAVLAGSAAYTKTGGSFLILSGNNTYSGGTTLTSGVIRLGHVNGLGTGTLTFNGGALGLSTTLGTIASPMQANANVAYNFDTLSHSATVSTSLGANGSNALTKVSTGTLALSGANTFTGATTVTGGVLNLANALALQNSAYDTTGSVVGSGPAGLRTTATTLTLGGLTGNKNFAATGGVFSTTTGGYGAVTALTLNPGASQNHVYSGVISDGATGMTFTKTGLGTQTLTGGNTYTGVTTITAGTLAIGAADRIFDSSNLGLAGGTFDTGGFNETLGTLSLTETSSINFGSGGSILSFSGIGTSFDTTKSLSLLNWSGLDTGLGSDRLFVSNADVFSLAQLAAISFINPTNYAPGTYSAAQLASGEVVAVVPEPSSLVAIGLISLAILIRRQRWR